jgi:hypothetical protein
MSRMGSLKIVMRGEDKEDKTRWRHEVCGRSSFR